MKEKWTSADLLACGGILLNGISAALMLIYALIPEATQYFVNIFRYYTNKESPQAIISVIFYSLLFDIGELIAWIGVLYAKEWGRKSIILVRGARGLAILLLVIIFPYVMTFQRYKLTILISIALIFYFTRPKVRVQFK